MATLHVENFPDEMKQTMQEWGARQISKESLTRIVIAACQDWTKKHISETDEETVKLAKIAELKRQIEALERGA